MGGSPWGGSEELWAATAKHAIASGAAVVLSVYRWPSVPSRIAELQSLGAELVQRMNPNQLSPIKRALNRIIAHIASPFEHLFTRNPDVICISEGKIYESLALRGLVPRLYTSAIPYIVVCHGNNEVRIPHEQLRKSAIRFFCSAHRVIFVSQRNIAIAERQLATALSNAQVLQNPLNLSDTSMVPWPATQEFCMALVGRLEAGIKGHDLLFEILGSPAWKNRQWLVRVVGDGPDRAYLESLAHYYGIDRRVAFTGYVDDVRSIWALSHLMVMPSRSEALPIALVEAMACGRPAVTTDVGGISEWVEDDRTGFIAEAASVKSFGAALEKAWLRRDALQTMGMRAHTLAVTKIDPHPGKTLFALVREAAKSRGRKTP